MSESLSLARWSVEKANAWYDALPWLVGCNFIPSTAINQLEMWQADTFDASTIDRELGWAAGLGMNSVRVYLHDLLWDHDRDGFLKRIDQFLGMSHSHGIRPLFVFFDDCWNANPAIGMQPAPKFGVHNSGWLQSPGGSHVGDTAQWPRLERYVTGVVNAFRSDERILLWDVYNEPGNLGRKDESLPLLKAAFEWARAGDPMQPLSAGVWFDHVAITELELLASDVITFHNYNAVDDLQRNIATLKAFGRPLICTEYMARKRKSTFEDCLPVFKQERVGCYNWGFVAGKTNTIYAWESPMSEGEPEEWFHDIFRVDGTPFKASEVAAIRAATGK